ncbi:ROK family protein [Jiangella anatolica]|uniref:ROK family protein n=1 Tax=Jiangella anatolica TaxID=2670374 RepID=UPI0018F284B1|nr:ROK family protein [Jiangella anatolica]
MIAVDVGGTSIKAGVLGPDGRLGPVHRTSTPPAGPDGLAVVDAVEAIVRRLADELSDGSPSGVAPAGGPAGAPVAAGVVVGVVVPGIVDEAAGVAVHAENLGWRDVPLRSLLSERLGCPVAVGHDVRAGGMAEHRLGACRGERNAVFLPVGTGIAAALILDGRVFAGDGYAGELGHVDVGHDLPCACGGRGCLEAIASASAVTRRYALAAGAPVAGSREVAELVRRGDPAAVAVWDEALDALAYGLSMLVGVVAPAVVAIGGGLGESPDLVLRPLTDRLAERLTFQRLPRVVAAELGDRAGCVGAGLLAREPMP